MGLDGLTVEISIFQILKARIQTWFNSTLSLVPFLFCFIPTVIFYLIVTCLLFFLQKRMEKLIVSRNINTYIYAALISHII